MIIVIRVGAKFYLFRFRSSYVQTWHNERRALTKACFHYYLLASHAQNLNERGKNVQPTVCDYSFSSDSHFPTRITRMSASFTTALTSSIEPSRYYHPALHASLLKLTFPGGTRELKNGTMTMAN